MMKNRSRSCWAGQKKMLETKNYPTEKYQVNACTSIIDGKLYLESLFRWFPKTGKIRLFILPLSNCGNIEKSGKVKRSNVSFRSPQKMHNALWSDVPGVHYAIFINGCKSDLSRRRLKRQPFSFFLLTGIFFSLLAVYIGKCLFLFYIS